MRTIRDVETWARAHPTQANGESWANYCEAFIYRSGVFTQPFLTAYDAANASGPLDPNPTTAQPGEIHYWGGGAGHDAWQTEHGLLMASNSVNNVGVGLGYLPDVPTYNRLWPSHNYLGHTWNHGTQHLNPIPPEWNTHMQNAAIIRNYAMEATGTVCTALLYPDGTLVKLNGSEDVTSACIAHIQIYGIQPTTLDPNKTRVRDKYGSQLSQAQWDAWIGIYPGNKIGF